MRLETKPDIREGALILEQWPATLPPWEVMDAKTFYKLPPEGTFKVIHGLGAPLVIYGNAAPGRRCASDSLSTPAPKAADRDREPRRTSAASENSPFLNREQVAQMLGCHPDKLSWWRYREKMEAEGLIGRRIAGSRKMWRREDVEAYATRKGLTGKRAPGRPRKNFDHDD